MDYESATGERLEYLTSKGRMRQLGLFRLERRRLGGGWGVSYQCAQIPDRRE